MSDDMQDRPGDGRKPGKQGPGRRPGLPPAGPAGGRMIWVVITVLLVLAVYMLFSHARRRAQEPIKLSEFRERLDQGRIATVVVRRDRLTGRYHQEGLEPGRPREYICRILDSEIENLMKALYDHQKANPGKIKYEMEPGNEFYQFFLLQLLPVMFIILIVWYLLARQFRGGGGASGILSFGKARARLHTKEKSDITFENVAGVDEAREEVEEIVDFLKNPAKFRRLGGRIPKGVLLVGPPGCGKTLLAKAIAGEADVPFFSISGSDFVEMFVGVGASRVRDLFRQTKESAPCILFLDEIDAVGRRRAIDLHGASAEGAQTLNAILVEMDGFGTDDNVIVLAATNRPDVLDPALRRPGRFDREVRVELPDIRGREAILRVHAKKYKLAADVDLRQLARGTPMFSGADLEAVLNEAALLATRNAKSAVEMADMEEARDKIRWGRQRRSMVLTEDVRRTTAYHEGGHAIVAKLLSEYEPLHKVSIIPQGGALGMTMSLPEHERYNVQRKEVLARLCVLLAGRAAEESFCEDIDSGAMNDLDRATDIARNMVCRWGMSEELGLVSYHDMDEPLGMGMGHEILRARPWSEKTAEKIDREVERLINRAYERAVEMIRDNRDAVDRLAKALLKYEVLYAKDVDKILAGEEIVRPAPSATPTEEPQPEDEAEKPPAPEYDRAEPQPDRNTDAGSASDHRET